MFLYIIFKDSNGLIDRKELKQVLEALFDLRGVPESDRIGKRFFNN